MDSLAPKETLELPVSLVSVVDLVCPGSVRKEKPDVPDRLKESPACLVK